MNKNKLTEEQKKERKRERSRKYYQKNKEKILEKIKKYKEENKEIYKEKNSESCKKYYHKTKEKNREKYREKSRKYKENNPEKYHMLNTIRKWKSRGLIDDDYEKLYHLVMSQKLCWRCNCILTIDPKGTTSTTRCMDHDHDTGKFRGVVCNACNVRGGYKGGDC